jgi:hypothetical protein
MNMNYLLRLFFLFLAFLTLRLDAQFSVPAKVQKGPVQAMKDEEFVIKRPGEITFTSGIIIEGRIEKPHVMLVLTKERIKLEPLVFQQSFLKNITSPLRFNTFEISNYRDANPEGDEERKTRRNQ